MLFKGQRPPLIACRRDFGHARGLIVGQHDAKPVEGLPDLRGNGRAVSRTALPLLALTATLVAAGDVSLAIALGSGDLAPVSVLGSLDSIVSVLLARLVLAERLSRTQAAGILAALTGAVLLAPGGG